MAARYHLKFVMSAEAYWVWDRTQPDRSNCHMWIGAKNETGREWINEILSQANETGFYGQPRLDPALIDLLPAGDVWITTACVAGWKYRESDEDRLIDFYRHLYDKHRDNFMFEVQYHNTPSQKELNRYILDLQRDIPAPIIMGCDSHYIQADGGQDRTDFLTSKEMSYPDEAGWYLDYPDGAEAVRRFEEQGVLSSAQIQSAINQTNCFLEVAPYECDIFNDDVKLFSLHPDWTQEQKDAAYERLVYAGWEKDRPLVDQDRIPEYEREIRREVDTVKACRMADYFIDNYYIMKRGKELGGHLTSTGRGSAVSFYTNKLLGFTEVDRIAAKVHMYPERFMTAERILETRSLPDIDFNVAEQDIFAKAQADVCGADHAVQMIAYGTQKASAAWKMFAKSQGVDFQMANEVSAQIKKYEDRLKHATEEDRDEISIYDFIDQRFHDIYRKSKEYQGIIVSWSPAPCAFLLYQGSIRRKIGLVRIKDRICCLMDGHWAEENHFLKNDLLRVAVVDLISRGYARAGVPLPSVNELLAMCPPEDPCWDIYRRGCTIGINQVEQPGTSSRVGVYSPKNISELCAFVAAIRPGFKSMYKVFESRQDFSYGVTSFDNLLRTQEMPQSFCLYQEQQMAALNFAGFPMSECYAAIKNIAKKRVEKVLAYKERFIAGFSDALIREENVSDSEAAEKSHMVWQILEDSARYSFNACVSGDTRLFRAAKGPHVFEPTVEEMFLIKNDASYAKATGHSALHKKYCSRGYGKIISMTGDHRGHLNQLIDISYAGERQTFRITLEDGRYIDCTDNHKFPTPSGEKRTDELHVGDLLYVTLPCEVCKKKYPFTDGRFESNFPSAGERGFQRRENGASVVFNAERGKHLENSDPCSVCGASYSKEKRFELHHKNFDRTDNSPENLQWCCAACHKKIHYAAGRVKRYEKGYPIGTAKIVSISQKRVERVYDVEMASPYHNFALDNGIITSNSHSYCVSLDSLYGAWLKAHYPYAFYETYMRIMSDKDQKEKIAAAKDEAIGYFGISFPPFLFGQDNRQITADESAGTINNALSSVKGFSRNLSSALYDAAGLHTQYLTDILLFLRGRGFKRAATEPLAKISYFQPFGNDRFSLRLIDLVDRLDYAEAASYSRDLVDNSFLHDIVPRFSNGLKKDGSPATRYTITNPDIIKLKSMRADFLKQKRAAEKSGDTESYVDALENIERCESEISTHLFSINTEILHLCEAKLKSANIEDLPFRTRIHNQFEILGSLDLVTGKPEDRKLAYIEKVRPLLDKTTGKPWGYSIFTQSLGTGKKVRLTLRASLFNRIPVKEGSIIYADRCSCNKSGFWSLNEYRVVDF